MDHHPPESFQSALVAARGDRRQAALAAELNVSQATISSWEATDSDHSVLPRANRLDAIAVAYGIDVSKLRDLWHAAHAIAGTAQINGAA